MLLFCLFFVLFLYTVQPELFWGEEIAMQGSPTGFAIIISFIDKELIKYLKKYNIYDNVIFTFEFTLIIGIITFILSLISKYIYYSQELYYINLGFFIYLLACLIQLILFITSFGVKKGELYS